TGAAGRGRRDPVLPPADEQRPDPGRGGRAAVRRGRVPAQGRVRRGVGVRTGAGGHGALDPLQRREEARGVPREERAAPGDRRRRRTGVPGAYAGQPAAGAGTRAGRGVPRHARTGPHDGSRLRLATPSLRGCTASRTLVAPRAGSPPCAAPFFLPSSSPPWPAAPAGPRRRIPRGARRCSPGRTPPPRPTRPPAATPPPR